jgi:hypothetical protein
MTHSNQEILRNFMGAICRVVSEGTSDTYAAMVITKFSRSNSAKFPFVKHITLDSNKVQVDKKVDSVSPKLIGAFIKKMMDSLFSDLFKRLVKRQLGIGLLEDLKDIGVKI